jgi:hypothetical protein
VTSWQSHRAAVAAGLCVAACLVSSCASPNPSTRPTSGTPDGQGPPSPTVSPSPSAFAYALPPQPAGFVGDVHMYNTSIGWAQRLDDGAVLHTTHGVKQWTVSTPPLTAGQAINAVVYLGAYAAHALSINSTGEQTTVDSWSTSTGGVSWVKQGSFTIHGPVPADEGGLDFVDAEHGWWSVGTGAPTGNSAMSGTVLYRTVDSGATWSEVAWTNFTTPGSGNIPSDCHGLSPAAEFDSASFASPSTGWITGWCDGVAPYFAVTHDGGLHWSQQTLPVSIPSSDGPFTVPPQFTSSAIGALLMSAPGVGPDATLYLTSDGGLTWQARSTPEAVPQALDFINADDGWLLIADSENAGPAGLPDLWVTHNAGVTWTSLLSAPGNSASGYSPTIDLGGLDFDFLTPEIGWAAPPWPSEPLGGPDLLQSSDGGRQWVALTPRIIGAPPSQ